MKSGTHSKPRICSLRVSTLSKTKEILPKSKETNPPNIMPRSNHHCGSF